RPPEPLSKAKERAEAAVALSPQFSMSTLRARSVSLHHDGVCTKHLFGHRRTMMTRANSLHRGRRVAQSMFRSLAHEDQRRHGHSRTHTALTTAAPGHDGRKI